MSTAHSKDLAAARQGDLDAFGRLVLAHQDRVRAFLGARLYDKHQIDDLSQECFIIAFNKLAQFRDDASFSAWLRSIAHNLLRNYWRSRKDQQLSMHDDIVSMLEDQPDSQLEDEVHWLRKCLQKLPGPSRQLLQARYADDQSIADLCKAHQIKHSAMTMNLHRLRHQIKRCIEQQRAEA